MHLLGGSIYHSYVLLQSSSSSDQDGLGPGAPIPNWHLLVLQHHQNYGRCGLCSCSLIMPAPFNTSNIGKAGASVHLYI